MVTRIIISVLLLTITLLFMPSCKPRDNNSRIHDYSTRSLGFTFKEPRQSQFLKTLDYEKIDYVIDSDGYIRVNLDQYAEFLRIQRVFIRGEEINPYIYETVSISSKEMEDRYIEEFTKENIPYSIKINGVIRYFSISQEYSPVYDQIVQKIHKEFRSEWK